MRAGAKNFELKDIKKIVNICHSNDVKANLALNTIIYDNELGTVEKIIISAKKSGVDAIIAWDMAVINLCIKHKMNIHLSTQASVSNIESLRFYKKNIPKLKRIILARECTLEDIKKIIDGIKKEKLDVEIETFIHGAMCVSVSGRCFLSQELFNKSANRGECLQPCRRKYDVLLKDPEEGHELILGADYVMSPKDLCTIDIIDQLIESGINVFKIEGRNKSPEYVKKVTECYRKIIDHYFDNKDKILKDPAAKKGFEKLKKDLKIELLDVFNRGFSTGFYLGKPVDEWHKDYGSDAKFKKEYSGKVMNYYPKIGVAEILIESSTIIDDDDIMFQGPTTGIIEQIAENIKMHKIKDKNIMTLKTKDKVRINDKLYKIVRNKK